jgi:glycosyltransferase involved in cell wall biosynthesis
MFNDKIKNLPAVSIIIPVYNNEENIGKLIKSLLKSDYPKELFEIIIVDNGSNDRTKEIVRQYTPVALLEEKNIQSSYAARNKGIQYAKNEILAFIDSDCIANSQWIKNAVLCLNREKVDLLAGNVIFKKTSNLNIFEIYDSHMYLQQEYNASIGASTTANLVVKKNVFNSLGLFPIVQSGGDVKWTNMAVNKGFKLIYCENAKVFHPARKSLEETIKKEIRLCENSTITFNLINFHYKEIKGKIFLNNKNHNAMGLFWMIFLLKNIFKLISVFILSINSFIKM